MTDIKAEDSFLQPKITGYRQLTEEEAILMNTVKAEAERIGQLTDMLMLNGSLDTRWIAIGRTQLQQGFMAVVRGIAQPTTF